MLNFKNYFYILFIGFYMVSCKSPRQACYQSRCATNMANCSLMKQYVDSTPDDTTVKQKENDETLTNSKSNDYIKGSLTLKSFKDTIEITAKFKDKNDIDNYYFAPAIDIKYELKYQNTEKDTASCSLFLYASDIAQIEDNFLDNKDPASLEKIFGTKLGDITEKGYSLSLKNNARKKLNNYVFIHCKPKNEITSSKNYSFKISNNSKSSQSETLKNLLSLKNSGNSFSSYFKNKKVSDTIDNKNVKNAYSCEQSKKECYQKCDSTYSF